MSHGHTFSRFDFLIYNNDMIKFYVVRHGQTDYNKIHRIQGRLDVPLNEVGLKQAKMINY